MQLAALSKIVKESAGALKPVNAEKVIEIELELKNTRKALEKAREAREAHKVQLIQQEQQIQQIKMTNEKEASTTHADILTLQNANTSAANAIKIELAKTRCALEEIKKAAVEEQQIFLQKQYEDSQKLKQIYIAEEKKRKASATEISQLRNEIKSAATMMHADVTGLHKQFNDMQNSYGNETFTDALHEVIEEMERKEDHIKKNINQTLDDTMELLSSEQRRANNETFWRLSSLDHHEHNTSNLVKHEVSKVNADLHELHNLTVKEIHNLSEKARKQLDAIQNVGERMNLWELRNSNSSELIGHQEQQQHQYRQQQAASISLASSHVLEQALSMSEARCEKAELKYERAADHIRHLHSIVHERRKGIQNRLSQLIALDTVFLSSEKIYDSRNNKNTKNLLRKRKKHRSISKDGSLAEDESKKNYRGSAVVHLWR
jgi:hypothetical protein